MILENPSNATVAAGEEVTFRCSFSGTIDLPLWNIGGTIYSSSDLPAGFQYTEEGLHIPAVWESLNHTRFICFFIIYDGGHLSRVNSSPAYLVVYCSSYTGRNDAVEQLPKIGSTATVLNVIDTNCTNCTSGKTWAVTVNVISSTSVSNTNCTNCTSGETEPVSRVIGKSYLSMY